MVTRRYSEVSRYVRQTTSVFAVVALSVAATLAAQHLLTPPSARAQGSPAQEVRASAFVLLGADGTVLARLGAGPNGGGNFMLLDAAGNPPVTLGAAGNITVRDADGTYRFLAGHIETPSGTAVRTAV